MCDFWDKIDEWKGFMDQESRVNLLRERLYSELQNDTSQEVGNATNENPTTNSPADVLDTCSNFNMWPDTPNHSQNYRQQVLDKIENVMKDMVTSVSKLEPPVLTYSNTKTWNNISFDGTKGMELMHICPQTAIKFDSILSVNKLALTFKVLESIYKLVQSNQYCTKRDLFYQDPKTFGSQSQVDGIVDNISCMLKVPRWNLHILASSKGYIAGDLLYTDVDGNVIDCSSSNAGVLVPSHVHGIKNLQTNAKVVLVVEKDASFQHLIDSGLLQQISPCILITGKGFPDVNTRLMVKKLWDTFHIPTLALMDADPHGIEIMAVYKFGSRALAFEAPSLALPSMKWLGVLPSDIERFHISKEQLIPLSKSDIDKANDLLKRPYIASQEHLKKEIEYILRSGVKAEIQCLYSVSPTFLSQVYIPNKIKYGGWI